MIKVTAKAPTRIDLAGGTLDLWPIHQLLDHKATVNVGVTLDAQVEIVASSDALYHFKSNDQNLTFTGSFEQACACQSLPILGLFLQAFWRRDLPALTITTSAKSPAGAGLGGSSCLAVTIGGALWQARRQVEEAPALREEALVATAQDIEARLINAPTGCQDYWGAVRGGINAIRFPAGRVVVTTKAPAALAGLQDELILCYSGKSRASAINNWEIFKRVFDGDRQLLSRLSEIGELAEQCADAAMSGDLASTLALSKAEWKLRRQLWPNIATPETDRLETAAIRAGASFARVCGAGGGGVMAIFAPKVAQAEVRKALLEAGGLVLAAVVATDGLQVHSG